MRSILYGLFQCECAMVNAQFPPRHTMWHFLQDIPCGNGNSWISIVIILTFSWLLDCIDVYGIVGAHAIVGFMALGIRFFHALVSICWIAQKT